LRSLDDAAVVEAVDGIKSGVGDGDGVMLGKLALCEDAVKELSASGELKKKRCNIGREADDAAQTLALFPFQEAQLKSRHCPIKREMGQPLVESWNGLAT